MAQRSKIFLERIGNKTWFHKITKLDPKEIVDNLEMTVFLSEELG